MYTKCHYSFPKNPKKSRRSVPVNLQIKGQYMDLVKTIFDEHCCWAAMLVRNAKTHF